MALIFATKVLKYLRGSLSKTVHLISREKQFRLKLWQVKGFIGTIAKIGLL